MSTKQFTFRVPKGMDCALRAYADKYDCSMSSLLQVGFWSMIDLLEHAEDYDNDISKFQRVVEGSLKRYT